MQLDVTNLQKSIALKNELIVEKKERKKLIDRALDYFNNDSFWLIAPYKVFDKGTSRSIVDLDDGTQGLLVTYNSGGSTPGDSYLWKLKPNGFPYAYKMWAGIIPIGGIEVTWDDWMQTESGMFLPKSHQLGPLELSMGNLKAYN